MCNIQVLVQVQHPSTCPSTTSKYLSKGFMQDQIIASHTCLSGHMDVKVLLSQFTNFKMCLMT